MLSRRWNGLHVALVDTPAGASRVPAAAQHRLGLHVGRPVRATCRCDGRTHRRLQSRGDIDLVPAGLAGVWEDDRATTMLMLSVSPSLLGAAATGLGLDPDRVELVPQFQLRDPQLQHLGWALEAELQAELAGSAAGDSLYGETLALALAVQLVRRYRTSAAPLREPARGLSRAQLGRVTEYIEAHLDRPLTLAELAALVGLSASHFKTLFKGATGVPVHQFVVARRVERARRLIEQGRLPLPVIAQEAGFSDQSHMARWLRRLLGVRPAALVPRGG